jgi:hypothetical protein
VPEEDRHRNRSPPSRFRRWRRCGPGRVHPIHQRFEFRFELIEAGMRRDGGSPPEAIPQIRELPGTPMNSFEMEVEVQRLEDRRTEPGEQPAQCTDELAVHSGRDQQL